MTGVDLETRGVEAGITASPRRIAGIQVICGGANLDPMRINSGSQAVRCWQMRETLQLQTRRRKFQTSMACAVQRRQVCGSKGIPVAFWPNLIKRSHRKNEKLTQTRRRNGRSDIIVADAGCSIAGDRLGLVARELWNRGASFFPPRILMVMPHHSQSVVEPPTGAVPSGRGPVMSQMNLRFREPLSPYALI